MNVEAMNRKLKASFAGERLLRRLQTAIDEGQLKTAADVLEIIGSTEDRFGHKPCLVWDDWLILEGMVFSRANAKTKCYIYLGPEDSLDPEETPSPQKVTAIELEEMP